MQSILGLMGLLMACATAAPFQPPAEGPVPFRRDRLPLDTDGISQLSKAVVEIAESTGAKTGVERRALAQMLAVSLALDPSGGEAKDLLRELPKRGFEAHGDVGEGEKQRVWKAIEWLETPDAGIDGQALAACLKDVMVVADPKHPRSQALRSTGEQAAWSGWVPVLAEYEPRKEIKPPEEDPKEENPTRGQETPPSGPVTVRLANASLTALLWKNVAKDWPPRWELTPMTLTMRAEIRPREQWQIEQGIHRKTISIGSYSESHSLGSMESKIENTLRTKFGSLPQDMVLEIRHPDLDQSIGSGNRHALSGVCGALAQAALTGVEPTGMIIGQLDDNGKFLSTSDFWLQMGPVAEMSGIRLIVPAETEEVMMAFLALEKPDFFLKNEVLVAKDLDDISKLGAKKMPPPMDGVFEKFREIQSKRGAQDVRTYIVNSFIRQRLQSIYQEEPRHLSAKALVLQSTGNRPTQLSRLVMASEMKKIVEEMRWVRKSDSFQPRSTSPLVPAYQGCRTKIDQIERYGKKEDRDMIDKALKVVDAVRDLERATRGRGEYWEVENEIRTEKRAFDSVFDEYDQFISKILER